jgi:hypothetical protein
LGARRLAGGFALVAHVRHCAEAYGVVAALHQADFFAGPESRDSGLFHFWPDNKVTLFGIIFLCGKSLIWIANQLGDFAICKKIVSSG